jgi:hypothetical protein
MALVQQIHTELAFMSISPVQCPLPDPGGHSNLMHANGINALLGEEPLGNLQNTLAMLRCIAPFVPHT